MTPAPASPTSAPDALRKQLILAQVQLMELEDLRDALQTELAATREQLEQSRRLADNALQAQAQTQCACQDLGAESPGAAPQRNNPTTGLLARLAKAQADLARRDQALSDAHAELTTLRKRIEVLDAERRALKASFCWRCTMPLRAIARLFHPPGGRPT